MRAGGCTVQQALTAEAASVVKQAVALARRRGHAQVSPLHVANTMLTASTGLLRMACLQSHSHPLQCKALELCFNVALNRLPASTSGPMLGTHSHHQHFPSISNALVAAFKRAQAHQRRGSIENQQQPLLAVKIELEQLILSILDDPSVSRVMREAGFNSTQVKSNVEQAVCLEMCNSQGVSSSTVKCNKESSANVLDQTKPKFLDPIRNEDVMSVIENLMNRRRKGSVIVGECVSTIEGVVKGVMDKFDKGEVPEGLRDVKLMTLSLSSLGHLSIIEQKLKEIKSHVNKSSNNRGFVLYLGDLKWIVEQRSSEQLEHMIREIGKLLVCTESGRLWILGVATFQTYMRCKTSYPSLESVWGLHPLTIPSNSLCLSLISSTDSDLGSQSKSSKAENGHNWILVEGEELTCCAECSAKFENEAKILHSSTNSSSCSTTSTLPAWFQQYKNESQTPNSMDQDFVSIKDLCKKWNSICSSKHQHQRRSYSSEKTLTFSSLSPSPSTSGFSYDQHGPNLHQSHYNFSVLESKHPWRDYNHIRVNETVHNCPTDHPNFRMYIPPSASNPNSIQNSASSSDLMEIEYVQKFNVYNSDNLTTLCNALERKVPSQKDIIQDIASTILQCRSGMVKRPKDKRETWLLFQGNDVEAKEKIAKELARIIFGGSSWTDNFVSISLSSSFSSTRADSTDHHHQDCRNYKRSRDEQSCGYIERFVEAMSINPHRVFLVEDVEQADYCSQMGFKRAIESGGVISNVRGVEYGLSDAIIILSCKSFISRSRAWSPPIKEGPTLEETSSSHCVSTLDLNVSIEDIDSVEDQSIDEIGLLDFVDRRFVFRIPSW